MKLSTRKLLTCCYLLIVVSGTLWATHESFVSTMSLYKRPMTVLAIGKDPEKDLLCMPEGYSHAGIALIVPGGTLNNRTMSYVTKLAPAELSCSLLETLGRCEHFDVVIVRDLAQLIQEPLPRLLAALARLGDNLFILPDTQEFEQLLDQTESIKRVYPQKGTIEPLYSYHRSKKILLLARYTQKDTDTLCHYTVKSTLSKKELFKAGNKDPITWVPGINLVSFIMLYGIYPSDKQIREQLYSIQKNYPKHTDLVLGNLILHGDTLNPIDMNDSRRNADADRCIKAAIQAFKGGIDRLQDPHLFMKTYYKSLK